MTARERYAAAIPACCSYRSIEAHEAILLCWGLLDAVERGTPMDCSGCPERLQQPQDIQPSLLDQP